MSDQFKKREKKKLTHMPTLTDRQKSRCLTALPITAVNCFELFFNGFSLCCGRPYFINNTSGFQFAKETVLSPQHSYGWGPEKLEMAVFFNPHLGL